MKEDWRGVGGRFKRKGPYVYLRLTHVVWQKATIHCKAVTFQLKKKRLEYVWARIENNICAPRSGNQWWARG